MQKGGRRRGGAGGGGRDDALTCSKQRVKCLTDAIFLCTSFGAFGEPFDGLCGDIVPLTPLSSLNLSAYLPM
jgi:hypothetical protein